MRVSSPFFLVTGLIGLAFAVFTIIDAARRPEEQFVAAGQSKTLWIVLGVVGVFCAPPPGSGYQPPPGGGYQPPPGGDAPPPPPPG